jgi:CubicO group peptidase (beta-lactamase class C family)
MPHLSRFVTAWSMLQARVSDGRLPGWAAAVRYRGDVEVHTGGCLTLGGRDPVRPDSLFRLASVSKPVAGALTLALVEDGVLALDDRGSAASGTRRRSRRRSARPGSARARCRRS